MRQADLCCILSNLITNAAEAVQDKGGGTVTLGAKSVSDKVLISCHNDGPKITAQEGGSPFSYLFDSGYSTKGKNRGNGLAIVKRLVHENGGNIAVRNLKQGGVEFIVILPRYGE